MQQTTMLMLSVDDLKGIVQEAVSEAVSQLKLERGMIKQLPPLLTREEFMEVMRISSKTATNIINRPDFIVYRKGRILIETAFLFDWIRRNSDWVEENTGYIRSIS
ncbi:DNA-binding protein [Planococcus plakortidis]